MGTYKGSIKREDRGRARFGLIFKPSTLLKDSLTIIKFKICFTPLFVYNV
jgi:hypothetical protein